MILKDIVVEDFINFKLPSMFLIFPKCNFKCGINYCQNSNIIKMPDIEKSISDIIKIYTTNDITRAIVCGGMEPMDSWEELKQLFLKFREVSNDIFVIYTGYNEDEIEDKIEEIQHKGNLIVKYGRYIPNQKSHMDNILGVNLMSLNQYAVYYNPGDSYDTIK